MSILLPSERQQILARFESGPEGRKQFEAWMAKQPKSVQDSWEQYNQEYKDKFKKAGEGQDEEGMHHKEGPATSVEKESKWAHPDGFFMYVHSPMGDGDEDNYEPVNKYDPATRYLKPMTKQELDRVVRFQEGRGKAWYWQQFRDGRVVGSGSSRNYQGPDPSRFAHSKQASAGLYGYTKQTQADVERLVKRAQKQALALAKKACKKDARALVFMQAHAKRSKSLAAKVLLAAMNELPEEIKHRRASKEKLAGGMYGFPSDTARLCMASVADLSAYMGEQVFALNAKKAARHERITGFLKQHSKETRCAFSKHYLDLYPGAAKTASEDYDPHEIGSEVPGPHASDADEPWMEDQFTQQENSELQDLEGDGPEPGTTEYEVEVKVEEQGRRASRWLFVRATDRFAAMAEARQRFASAVEVGLPRELKGGVEVLAGGELVWED